MIFMNKVSQDFDLDEFQKDIILQKPQGWFYANLLTVHIEDWSCYTQHVCVGYI